MSDTTSDITVVVCAYTEKRWDDLLNAVASIRAQTLRPHELIIVIDHNAALYERVCSEIHGAVIIENNEQTGLSGARNTAIHASTGSIIAFMDEDAAAESDWLSRLHAAYCDNRVIGAGGAIEPDWLSGEPDWFPDEFRWVVGCTYLGMPQTIKPVRNLIGCNMSFRSTVFHAVGGFRNDIGRVGTRPVGCEETELCIRALQRWPSSVFLYDPAAVVHHRVPTIRTNWDYFRTRCYSEGLSKVLVSQYVGAKDGLASERSYTTRVLPSGIWRNLGDSFGHRNLSGLRRAGAIMLGLGFTSAGYIIGTFVLAFGKLKPTEPNLVK